MEKAYDSLRHYKKELFFGPLFKVLEVFFELLMPLLMKYVIDTGINEALNEGNYGGIIYPGILIIVFCFVGFSSTLVCQYLGSKASQGFGTELRNRIYRKVESLAIVDIERFGYNDLVTIITNDVNKMQQSVAMMIRLSIRAPVMLIGSMIFAFIINRKVAMIFLVITPFLFLIYFLVLHFSSRQFYKVQSQTDDIVQEASDGLNGARVIRSFNREKDAVASYEKHSCQYFAAMKVNSYINALSNPLTYLVINLAIFFVIYFSAKAIFATQSDFFIDSGDLVALISYLNQVLLALIAVCNLIVVFTKAHASEERINGFFKVNPSVVDKKLYSDIKVDLGAPLIVAKNVSFSYIKGGNKTVYGLNFAINKGETVGFIGGTGSGKTTIARLIDRFFDPSEGEMIYKGVNLADYDLAELKKEISLVSQKSVLFKGTIKSNLEMAKRDASEEEMHQALSDACADDFVTKYRDGLNHPVEEGGRNYSGGQRQRLSLTRSLLVDSEVLILDDSTSALDYLTDRNVRANIKKRKDLTTIIISQRVTTLRSCDRIFVVDGGTIIASGKHEELLYNCSIYKEIYESQVRSN
jgi:ATP-binding cassette subfamily B protein